MSGQNVSKLHIESVQDEQKLKSKSNQAGLSVGVSFGDPTLN
ncbi:hypothetical protein [Avibacterium avium]